MMLHTNYLSPKPCDFGGKDFYFISFVIAMTEFCMEMNSLVNKLGKALCKKHFRQVLSNLTRWFQRRCLFNELWMTDGRKKDVSTTCSGNLKVELEIYGFTISINDCFDQKSHRQNDNNMGFFRHFVDFQSNALFIFHGNRYLENSI